MEDKVKLNISKGLADLVIQSYLTAEEKGFWEGKEVENRFPEAIALIHSELSEALEAHREGNIKGSDGVYEELADTMIRIADLVGHLEMVDGAEFNQTLIEKMEYNETREQKHGKEY